MADIRRLPVPVTEIWEWQLQGACRGMDSAFFFHPEGERGPARANREARAKQICQRCPVLEQCRRHALAVHEPYGVWGGLSESERDDDHPRPDRSLRIPRPARSAGRAAARPNRHASSGPTPGRRPRARCCAVRARAVSGRDRGRDRPAAGAPAAPACRPRRSPW